MHTIIEWLRPSHHAVAVKLDEAERDREKLKRRMDDQLARLGKVNRLKEEITAVEGRMRGRS